MLMDLGPNVAQPAAEIRRIQQLIRLPIHLFFRNKVLTVIILLEAKILGLHRLNWLRCRRYAAEKIYHRCVAANNTYTAQPGGYIRSVLCSSAPLQTPLPEGPRTQLPERKDVCRWFKFVFVHAI